MSYSQNYGGAGTNLILVGRRPKTRSLQDVGGRCDAVAASRPPSPGDDVTPSVPDETQRSRLHCEATEGIFIVHFF